MAAKDQHFLIVSFPAQGHVNPSLELAKGLARLGARVTFSTSNEANRRLDTSSTSLSDISFSPFSQGKYDKPFSLAEVDHSDYLTELETAGTKTLTAIAAALADEGNPVTCIIFNFLVPWARDVAAGLAVPAVLYWIQAAALFHIYYLFFNGYSETLLTFGTENFRDLPLLQVEDLPSILRKELPEDKLFYPALEATFKRLSPRVLVNTFDELEKSSLKSSEEVTLVAVGPAQQQEEDVKKGEEEYLEWLKEQREGSVVYVAFGSHSVLPYSERVQISEALALTGRPYLWVARGDKEGVEVTERGKVVEWCSQVEVLASGAVGCFVSHCGWNSTLESILYGVPIVGLPQWTDQMANSVLAEDWEIGVRAEKAEAKELLRCINLVMGEGKEGKAMRKKVKELAGFAKEALMEGGSSDLNLKSFAKLPKG